MDVGLHCVSVRDTQCQDQAGVSRSDSAALFLSSRTMSTIASHTHPCVLAEVQSYIFCRCCDSGTAGSPAH